MLIRKFAKMLIRKNVETPLTERYPSRPDHYLIVIVTFLLKLSNNVTILEKKVPFRLHFFARNKGFLGSRAHPYI